MKFTLRDGLKARGYPWSNKHLLTLEQRGLFPRRVPLAGADGKTVAWITEELDEHDARVIADRDKPRPPGVFRGNRYRKVQGPPAE